MARESYETTYGIRDHRLETNPLAPYMASDAEKTYGVSMWYSYSLSFMQQKVAEYTDLNVIEWFDLPIDKALWLLDYAYETNKERLEQEEKINMQLKAEQERLTRVRRQSPSMRSRLPR